MTMSRMPPERHLIDGLASVYEAHRDELIRFATVLVGPHSAPDVVSSAVLRILDRPSVRVRNHRAYLYQTVLNEARNLKRSEARRRMREDRAPLPNSVTQPEPYPEVREALEQLSAQQRAVVYLVYWEDLTEKGAAERLNLSPGSVHRHLERARKRLRRVLHAFET